MSEEAQAPQVTWRPLEMPEIGIGFRRYRAAGYETFVCGWRNEYDSHVYEARIQRVENGWCATCTNDGRKLCAMLAPSRQLAYRFALGGMRAYLRRGHRKALKSAAKAREGAK